MPSTRDLPALNAVLNGSAAVLLLIGLYLIKTGRRDAHRKVMVSALVVSAVFLASYLTYHALHGSTRFSRSGPLRIGYLSLLLTHTVLAVVNLPLIAVTVWRAYRGRFAEHRRIAKWTWFVWMYVSVTGVIVYLLLYQIFPGPPAGAEVRGTAQGGVEIYVRARMLHKQGKDEPALALYKEAAKAGHVGAGCFAAVIDDRLQGTETASVAIARALAAAPDDVGCLEMHGRLLVIADRAAEGLPPLERAVALAPDDAFAHATLGFAHFRLRQYDAAAEAFARSVTLDPSLIANRYNEGYARFLGGHYKVAKPLLEQAVASPDLDPELAGRAREHLGLIAGVLWACPMHPEITGKADARCSQCGMPLEPLSHGLPEAP